MATIVYKNSQYTIKSIDGAIDVPDYWDEHFYDSDWHGDHLEGLGLSDLSVGNNGHCIELYQKHQSSFDIEDWKSRSNLFAIMKDGLEYYQIKVDNGEAKIEHEEDNDSPYNRYDRGECKDRLFDIAKEITDDVVGDLSSLISSVGSRIDKDHDLDYDYAQTLDSENERDNVVVVKIADLGELDEGSDLASEVEEYLSEDDVAIVVLDDGEDEDTFWKSYREHRAEVESRDRTEPDHNEGFLRAANMPTWGSDERIETMALAIKNGANINAVNDYGLGALYNAVMEKEGKIVEFLLDNNVDLSSEIGFDRALKMASHKDNAINAAAWIGDLEVLKLLVEHGADIAGVNAAGENALHNAIFNENKEVVDYLLDNGLDVNNINKYGQTILGRAFEKEDDDLAVRLIEMGANPVSAISYSLEMYGTSILSREELWCEDEDGLWEKEELSMIIIDNWGEDSKNTLFHALYDVDMDGVINLAIDRMTHESINDMDDKGRTPLFSMVESDDLEVVNLLLKHGADPCIAKPDMYKTFYGVKGYPSDEDNNTPLHVVAGNLPSGMEMAEALMLSGARVDARNAIGKSVLDMVNDSQSSAARELSSVFESYELKQSSASKASSRRVDNENSIGL